MYLVEGYAFDTKEQEHTAKHEVEIIGYIRKKKCQHRPHFLYCRFYNAAAFRNFHHSHPERHDSCHRNG